MIKINMIIVVIIVIMIHHLCASMRYDTIQCDTICAVMSHDTELATHQLSCVRACVRARRCVCLKRLQSFVSHSITDKIIKKMKINICSLWLQTKKNRFSLFFSLSLFVCLSVCLTRFLETNLKVHVGMRRVKKKQTCSIHAVQLCNVCFVLSSLSFFACGMHKYLCRYGFFSSLSHFADDADWY